MKQKLEAGRDGSRVGPVKILVLTGFMFAVPAGVLFLAAGTWKWPMAWAYLGVTAVFGLATRLLALKKNPDLLQERASGLGKKDVASWDRKLMPLTAMAGPLVLLGLAGMDKRLGWSDRVPDILVAAALVVLVLGCLIGLGATVVNRYFSAVVRIQTDRGQTVVDAGPYSRVRHPGYAGAVAAYLATPVLLGTLWALVPALVIIGLIVLRTALEDRKLHRELDNYAEYAQRVRYRLFPGLW